MKNLLIVILALSPVLGFAKENRSGPNNSAGVNCGERIQKVLSETNAHLNKQPAPQGKSTAGGLN